MLRSAKTPERGEVTLWDGAVRQFGVRINRGGTKAFVVLLGSGRRKTIGRYPRISLAQARIRARQTLAEYTLGKHRVPLIVWDDAVAEFLGQCEQKNRARTTKDYARLLKKHLAFGARRLTDISKSDITRRIDNLVETPAERNHAIVVAKIFFNWAVRTGYLEQNPGAGLLATKRLPRERVLTADELRAVLRIALDASDNFSLIIALLILTGQRRSEIGSLRWDWIDRNARTIAFPAIMTKNKRAHTFPYGQMVEEALGGIAECSVYLFPASREHVKGKPTTSFNGWPKAKAGFDARCPIEPWTLHDLRRTFATNLAGLGTAPHVVERLLNHANGTISGVAAIYNRFSYMDEMREALDRWETRLTALLRG